MSSDLPHPTVGKCVARCAGRSNCRWSSSLTHTTSIPWAYSHSPDFPAVSGHLSRIEVVGSTDAYKDDYNWDGMMRTAALLLHSQPDVIKGISIGLAADISIGWIAQACFQSRKCEVQAATGSSRLG
jgi:hypothetical protein